MKKLTGVFLDSRNGKMEIKTIQMNTGRNGLGELYDLLSTGAEELNLAKTEMIEGMYIPVGKTEVYAFLDENGWISGDNTATAIKTDKIEHVIAGSAFIIHAGTDDEGNSLSITQADIAQLAPNLKTAWIPKEHAQQFNPVA